VREACGVFGIYGCDGAARQAYLGLYSLQHRGEESAGIVVSDDRTIRSKRGMGHLGEVISPDDFERLPGHMAIGHVRYSTTGSPRPANVQPLIIEYSKGKVAVAHNGTLTNARLLRRTYEAKGSIFQTSTDSEILARGRFLTPHHDQAGTLRGPRPPRLPPPVARRPQWLAGDRQRDLRLRSPRRTFHPRHRARRTDKGKHQRRSDRAVRPARGSHTRPLHLRAHLLRSPRQPASAWPASNRPMPT